MTQGAAPQGLRRGSAHQGDRARPRCGHRRVPVGLPHRRRAGHRRRLVPDHLVGQVLDRHVGRPARRRRVPGRRLRAHRARLHDGLRHPAHDQLRPRRDLHDRRFRRATSRPSFLRNIGLLNASPLASVVSIALMMVVAAVVAAARGPGHRARRLSAAAQLAPAGAAHRRHRRLVLPPVHRARHRGPGHLRLPRIRRSSPSRSHLPIAERAAPQVARRGGHRHRGRS